MSNTLKIVLIVFVVLICLSIPVYFYYTRNLAPALNETEPSAVNINLDEETKDVLPAAVAELQEQPAPKVEENKKAEPSEVSREVTLYRGNWFDIKYPINFTASPTTPIKVFNDEPFVETDEATFTSPDGEVEFFVFSPQWSGMPKDYFSIAENEEIIDEKQEIQGSDENKQYVRWETIKDKDGKYYRSFVAIENLSANGDAAQLVFGIKYKNDEAYQKYRDAYLAFKNSLTQYAD